MTDRHEIDIRRLIEDLQQSVDTVNMTANQVKSIMEGLVEKEINICENFPVTDVSLPEFALIVEKNAIVINYMPQSPNKWSVFVFHHKGLGLGEIEKVNSVIVPLIEDTDDEEDRYCVILAAQMFSIIQNRLLQEKDDFEVAEKRVRKKSHGKKTSRKGGRKVRLLKTYTLVRDTPIHINHKHGKITCPCWGVRGHYRHYKSGKVVFIEAYQKGKDRSRYTPKEYMVFQKESKNENH